MFSMTDRSATAFRICATVATGSVPKNDPAVVVSNQDDPEHAAHHWLGGQKRLEGLADGLAVEHELGRLPRRDWPG